MSNKITRTIVDIRYQAVHAQMMAEMNIEHLEPLETEDELLTAAVKICNKNKKWLIECLE
jgi:hypothetical protein